MIEKLNIELPAFLDYSWELFDDFPIDQIKLIEVDCGNINRISSSAASKWLKDFKTLRNSGAQVKFKNVTPHIMALFNTLKPDQRSTWFNLDELSSFSLFSPDGTLTPGKSLSDLETWSKGQIQASDPMYESWRREVPPFIKKIHIA